MSKKKELAEHLVQIKIRFKHYLAYIGKNETALAKEINVAQSTLNRVAQGIGLPTSTLLIPLAQNGVNINWLLLGVGKMFLKKSGVGSNLQIGENNVSNSQNINIGSKDSRTENKELEKDILLLKKENEFLKKALADKEEIINLFLLIQQQRGLCLYPH